MSLQYNYAYTLGMRAGCKVMIKQAKIEYNNLMSQSQMDNEWVNTTKTNELNRSIIELDARINILNCRINQIEYLLGLPQLNN